MFSKKSSTNSSFIIEKDDSYPFNKYIYPTCPKCMSFPICKLDDKQHKYIKINCLCSYKSTMNIDSYLNLINNNKQKSPKCQKFPEHYSINASDYCIECKLFLCNICVNNHNEWESEHHLISLFEFNCQCNIHDNKDTDFYCIDCMKHVCSFCYNKHTLHDFVKVDDIFDDNKYKEFQENFNHLKSYLNYLVEIKDKFIDNLKYEIKKIEDAFRYNKLVNDNILNFFKILIDEYDTNKKNYFLYKTFDKNIHLKINQLNNFNLCDTSKNNINHLINYFNSSFVYRTKSIKFDKMKEIRQIIGNNSQITSLLILKDKRIAAGSTDRSINIYSTFTFKCEMIINGFNIFTNIFGHSNTISHIAQNNNNELISSSLDSTIKLWSIAKYVKNITTLQGHTAGVIKAIAYKENILSCSLDKTIRLWQGQSPYSCLYIFEAHTDRVNSILLLNNNIQFVSGSSKKDNTLILWNLNSLKKEYTIKDCPCCYKNSIIQLDENKLLIGGQNSIAYIKIDTFTIIQVIEYEDIGCIMCILLNTDNTLIITGDLGLTIQYDIYHQRIISKKEYMHTKPISSIIKYGDKAYITGSWDGIIKIWK